jgi:hypothetical protein
MEAILVGTIRLCRRRFHGNISLIAVRDHLGTAWKSGTKLFHAPRSNHSDLRVKRFGSQLKAALVVSLTSRSMSVGVRVHLSCHLQADFRNQRSRDRSSQQVNGLVLRLPLQNREGEVTAQFLLGIHNTGGLCTNILGLLQNGRPVFARLT